MSTPYPPKYLTINAGNTKRLNTVVKIEGLPDLFSTVPFYTKVRYGDPGIVYGLPGLTYGGLRLVTGSRNYLMNDSGLVISQKIEPEQGRGSVQTMSLKFIDKDGYMSELIAPGVLLDEPLGNKLVTIYTGYVNSSFPDDYFRVFRGFISNTTSGAGWVSLELSDANIKNRQDVFQGAVTTLAFGMTAIQANAILGSTSGMFVPVIGVNGKNDWQIQDLNLVGDAIISNPILSGFSSITGIQDGMGVSGPGIRDGTIVVSHNVTFNTINISPAPIATNGPVTFTFSGAIDLSQSVRRWVLIDSEYMEVTAHGVVDGQNVNVFRSNTGTTSDRNTTPDVHDAQTAVTEAIQIYGNPIDLALKIYLSGWGGPWISGQTCVAVGTTTDIDNPNTSAILFDVDIDDAYGLTPGDTVTITGSGAGNNGTFFVTDVQDTLDGDPNRILVVSHVFSPEFPASGVALAFRSQYDTLPVNCGLKNTPQDVDVATFQKLRRLFFSSGQYVMRIFLTGVQTGKDFIESELFLPIGAYSITRLGRLSLAVTAPPIGSQQVIQLDETNVIKPETITVVRALNNRRFYNVVQYNYDVDDGGNFQSQTNLIDANSQGKVNITSLLPVNSLGVHSDIGGQVIVAQRGTFLLNRFKDAAYQINLQTNWEVGSLIEVGDVVVVKDPGTLQITDLETGKRGLGTRLFEVISRTLSIKTGNAQLVLLSSLGYTLGQRYATVSPSSQVVAGSTTSSVMIQDSYGALYPGNEAKKWRSFTGLPVVVHSYDWTRVGSAVFIGFDPTNRYRMLLATPLGFTPQPDDIVDVAPYGSGTDPNYIAAYKALYAFLDPTLTIVTGISGTQFTLSGGDAAQVQVNQAVLVHNSDYTVLSPECIVLSVIGTTVTLKTPLGFTPSAGQKVELVGFPDGGGPYRFL